MTTSDLRSCVLLIMLAPVALGCSSSSRGASANDSGASSSDSGAEVGSSPRGSGAGAGGDASTTSHDSGTGSGSGSFTLDAGGSDGGDGSTSGAPITGAPNDQWTWVDFPDSRCASGTPTGLAVNPHAGATNLLLYFEGGGSCADGETCWGPSPGATNLSGYDATNFAAKPPIIPTLSRSAMGNPFAGMNLVYVPYCTGDLHSGTRMENLAVPDAGTVPTYFYGATDVDVFLRRLVPTFATTTRVWVLGTSAGGFGTYLNFDRVANAFGVGVDLIDDSGPPLVTASSTTGNNANLFGIWGTTAGLPAGCTGCNSLRDVLNYDLTRQQSFSPPGEFGFLSFEEDTIISKDFGYTLTEYPMLMQTFSASLPEGPAVATLLVANYASHVVESEGSLEQVYLPWMTRMVSRNSGWVDEVYDVPGDGGM